MKTTIKTIVSLVFALCACPIYAEESDQEKIWDARAQATYLWQQKPSFRAAYSGPNSLSSQKEKAYTFSSTAYLGWRPASGLEVWFNPEVVQGLAFSGLHGLGGFPNGEQQKVSGPNPTFYRSRLFVRKLGHWVGRISSLRQRPISSR